MKKIGQKLSFLTKVMLVIGLLISNLSSLSVVFAYETSEDMVVTLNDELLEISYNQELADEVEAINVKVYENYTYSDGMSEDEVMNVYSLNAEELLEAKEGTLKLTYNSIFVNDEEEVNNFELFDGLYRVRVEIIDVTDYTEETTTEELVETVVESEVGVAEEEVNSTELESTEEPVLLTQEEVTETVLAVSTYEKEMLHASGLSIKLFGADGNEIVLVDGKYPVSIENSNVKVVAQILSGGLNPSEIFEYNGVKYPATELLELEFNSEKNFNGYLFGDYELPVEVKVNKVISNNETLTEEVALENFVEQVYNENINILYESYELNAALLNEAAIYQNYGESYMFYSESKNGLLYVLSEIGEVNAVNEENVVTRTMLDLYNMLNLVTEIDETEEQIITYSLLKNGVNVLESFVPANEEDTIENYLSTIMLDETVQIVITNDGLTITFDVVLAADLNNDNVITSDDVMELINQAIGATEVTDINKSDLYGFDEKVNSLDVLYLNQVVRAQVWNASLVEEEVSLNASLVAKFNGEEINEENYLTSGDEFTVDFVLSLTDYEVNGVSGLFNFDKSLFELVSVEVINEWLGNVNDGKFLYLGEESLTGPELNESESELPEEENSVVQDENSTDGEITNNEETVDYVVVTATFKALKATEEEDSNVITLKEIELFNSTDEIVTYYVLDENTVSTDSINVVASDDNTLSYLEVAGQQITLEDGVYEYEITVENDFTSVDLKYILGNVAANVTSTVYPEELVEGENTIIVTVTSESGVSQDYTIIVVREELQEETTTQVNYNNNNYENDSENQEEEVIVTPGDEEEDEDIDEEEESNLSRIIIIILILLVIAGLVYLIFKDEEDEETKKANKEINKLKKEDKELDVKTTVSKPVNKTDTKSNNKTNNKTSNKSSSKTNNSNKNKKTNNNKKER